jgi:hypothetical protein
MPDGTTAEELTSNARKAARDALEHYAGGELDNFARDATKALEHAAKAALAQLSPVLIAAPDHVESQLYLAGFTAARNAPERRIKTISCRQALERACHLIPTLRPQDAEQLISVRDGSTHFVVSSKEALQSLITPFLRSFDLLQKHLNLEDADVFGTYADLVKSLRERHTERVDQLVAAKKAHAKHKFAERYDHLDEDTRKEVFRRIEASLVLDGYDEVAVPCPACGLSAIVSGQHQLESWEADIDRDGTAMGAYPIVTLYADSFRCKACGLHLEGPDELTAAGLQVEIDLEDVDPTDFYIDIDEYDPGDYANWFREDV